MLGPLETRVRLEIRTPHRVVRKQHGRDPGLPTADPRRD